MKLSINVTNYSWPGGPEGLGTELREAAERADGGLIDTIWVADHLVQMDPTSTVEEPILEAYTALGFLASATRRVRLGAMVTWATLREPALLIKAVTTLDVLSGGRAWLGIGAGYQAAEAEMLDLPFPPTAERFDRLEELLQLAAHMWSGDERPFAGPFHRLSRPISHPRPVHRPPVLIGGMGEHRTLPLVARYADACNLFDIPDGGATIGRKLDVLARACGAIGRDRSEIEVTVSTRLDGGADPRAFADHCRALGALGVDHCVVITDGPWTSDRLGILEAADLGDG